MTDLTQRERQILDRVAREMGLAGPWLDGWLAGQRKAAPWLARALADAIGRSVHDMPVEYAVQHEPDRETRGGRSYQSGAHTATTGIAFFPPNRQKAANEGRGKVA